MDRHAVLGVASAAVIAAALAFSVSNILAVDAVRLGAYGDDKFRYFDMINRERVSICNTSPLYVYVDGVTVTITSDGSEVGRLVIPGGLLEPNSTSAGNGRFHTGFFERVQYLALHFDAMAEGVIPQRITPSSLVVTTDIRTSILGFIPYSASKSYYGLEFIDVMNGKGSEHSC